MPQAVRSSRLTLCSVLDGATWKGSIWLLVCRSVPVNATHVGYLQSFRSLQRWMLGGSDAGCGPVEEIPSLGEIPIQDFLYHIGRVLGAKCVKTWAVSAIPSSWWFLETQRFADDSRSMIIHANDFYSHSEDVLLLLPPQFHSDRVPSHDVLS